MVGAAPGTLFVTFYVMGQIAVVPVKEGQVYSGIQEGA